MASPDFCATSCDRDSMDCELRTAVIDRTTNGLFFGSIWSQHWKLFDRWNKSVFIFIFELTGPEPCLTWCYWSVWCNQRIWTLKHWISLIWISSNDLDSICTAGSFVLNPFLVLSLSFAPSLLGVFFSASRRFFQLVNIQDRPFEAWGRADLCLVCSLLGRRFFSTHLVVRMAFIPAFG